MRRKKKKKREREKRRSREKKKREEESSARRPSAERVNPARTRKERTEKDRKEGKDDTMRVLGGRFPMTMGATSGSCVARSASATLGAGFNTRPTRHHNFGSGSMSSHGVASRSSTTTTGPGRERGQLVVLSAVKKWVKPKVNPNTGKAVRRDMHVREGDTVKVIAGKDKGKVGEVVKVYRKGLKAGKIVVDDVNLVKKALKPKPGTDEERGKIILTEKPIHHSNVMLYSKDKQQVSRVGHKVVNGKKMRYLVKTGEVLQERLPQKAPPKEETEEGKE